ncbi:MAG: insulinase family protein [Lachnospiraceae bacterium]|nr:insulinase family protein [Lachnospiraceae bacterium]
MTEKEQVLQYYTLEEERESKDLHSTVYRLRHKKTGARIAAMYNEDENKVFYIGFRTPPTDSTGVPHILEHSVLCGSREFPVKDPFIELAKGSLNTFLNAMTYPDRTLYPVASCNDTDFQNLMYIYLDAVFFPNIYHEENIFRQEGWHYEMESPEAPLTVNGVVYNEMKGAFSSADEVFSREIMNSLYPDTCYALESGGDPECIPDLSYEQFLDYHHTLYHPSNSYIYLYGNMNLWEKLLFIHEHYLSRFDYLEMDTRIRTQQPFEKPVHVRKPYPVMEGEDTEQKAYLSYNVSVGTSLDVETSVALDILDYALCSSPGAVVRQALVDAGIGEDVYSTAEDEIQQPYFSIIAKDADEKRVEEFEQIIRDTLEKVVKEGIDFKTLQAAISCQQFQYKENDCGRWPKGLIMGLQAMGTWNYSDEAPFVGLELDEIYENLKEKAGQGYFEELVEKYLLNNNHRSIVELYPQEGLTEERDAAFAGKLAQKKAAMSAQELQKIIDDEKKLREYQDGEDSEEALATIPLLQIKDLKKEALKPVNDLRSCAEVKVLTHPVYTYVIDYLRIMFHLKDVPEYLMTYLPVLKNLLLLMDTDRHGYGDLCNEINLVCGSMEPTINLYQNRHVAGELILTFDMKAKMLYENIPAAMSLMQEVIMGTDFSDVKRLREILLETKSQAQSALMQSGSQTAATRAMSYFSRSGAVQEELSGLTAYRFLCELAQKDQDELKETAQTLQRLCQVIFRRENLMLDITAEKEGIAKTFECIEDFAEHLYTCDVSRGSYTPEISRKQEGFLTSEQVQYVCRAGNFKKNGLKYNGALQVLKTMLSYEYLWTQVRVKGGAYGCMLRFGQNGDCYFVSYRDPHLKRTVEVYENAAKAIAELEIDDRTMTQYIIGAISEQDTPLTPSGLGSMSLAAYMSGKTYEEMQRNRDELLACTPDTLRGLSAYVEAFMEDGALCVVGNAEKILQNKDMFETTEQYL